MALNPLYQLYDRVKITKYSIIDMLDNKTKSDFIILMEGHANAGENMLDLVKLADETFMWWNPGYKG